MGQPGRNDPCPCGSGKKYKRCCIELDTESNRTMTAGPMTIDKIRRMIDREMLWENELYRLLAHHLLVKINPAYGADNIYITVMFWQDFANTTMPIFQKYGAFCAALDYFTAYAANHHVTQTEVAKLYGVSSATVSKRYNELMDFAEEQFEALPEPGPVGNSRTDMERTMREVRQLLDSQNFESLEEAQSFINDFMRNKMEGTAPPVSNAGSKRDRVQDILYTAMEETSSAKRIKLAKEALKLYPDSPDAYLILAEEAPTIEKAINYFRQGIEAGERDLGETFFTENEGHFWGLIETRPYMRVKYNYAEVCWHKGDTDEARRHLEHILQLNPADNMGARYLLLAVYLYEDELEKAERLLEAYDESTAFFMYDRMVLEFKKRGVSAQLKMLCRSALNMNPHVPKYLLGDQEMPKILPEYYGSGDEDEAVLYVLNSLRVWAELPLLIQWLSAAVKA